MPTGAPDLAFLPLAGVVAQPERDAILGLLELHELPHLVELELSDSALDAEDARRLAANPRYVVGWE